MRSTGSKFITGSNLSIGLDSDDSKPATCIDTLCRRDDRPRHPRSGLRRFRDGVAAVATWIPGRTALAYGSGLLKLFGALGLLVRTTAAWSAALLFPYLIVSLLLKLPSLLVAPQMEAVWLGFCELAVPLLGWLVLFAKL